MQELKGVYSVDISFDHEKFITWPEQENPAYAVRNYRGQVKARILYATPALVSLCIIANRASLTRRVIGQIIDRMVMRARN